MCDDFSTFQPIPLAKLRGFTFKIPYYQRGYRWTSDNIITLLNDLDSFIQEDNENNFYLLQPLAVVSKGENIYEVVDGQQRLTTLYLINKYINKYITDKNKDKNKDKAKELYSFIYDKDEENNSTLDVITGEITGIDESSIDKYYITNAFIEIKKWFEEKKGKSDEEKFNNLFNQQDKGIEFLWFPVNSDNAHQVFQNINSGKIQLTNSELIKALLLNNKSCIANKSQVAIQFEQMERKFKEDKFWYMFNKQDIDELKGQSRMDFLFNISCDRDITDRKYQEEPRTSFFEFSNYDSNKLQNRWNEIRKNFIILTEFADDIYFYHYIAFLIYSKGGSVDNQHKVIKNYIEKYKTEKKSEFLKKLKEDISNSLKCNNKEFHNLSIRDKLNSYYHIDNRDQNNEKADAKETNGVSIKITELPELRKIFILHNIQTILERYECLKNKLMTSFEYFPFEMLYLQKWHIEHIDSHETNELQTSEAQVEWLNDIYIDYIDFFNNCDKASKFENRVFYQTNIESETESKQIKVVLNKEFINSLLEKKEETKKVFDEFKETFDAWYDESFKYDSITNKNGLGNLVLLDQHTNVFYQNALFPKKRRIVIVASGLKNNEKIENEYIPPCTRDIFLKSYNKTSDVKVNCWTNKDYEYYLDDIESKLKVFIREN